MRPISRTVTRRRRTRNPGTPCKRSLFSPSFLGSPKNRALVGLLNGALPPHVLGEDHAGKRAMTWRVRMSQSKPLNSASRLGYGEAHISSGKGLLAFELSYRIKSERDIGLGHVKISAAAPNPNWNKHTVCRYQRVDGQAIQNCLAIDEAVLILRGIVPVAKERVEDPTALLLESKPLIGCQKRGIAYEEAEAGTHGRGNRVGVEKSVQDGGLRGGDLLSREVLR